MGGFTAYTGVDDPDSPYTDWDENSIYSPISHWLRRNGGVGQADLNPAAGPMRTGGYTSFMPDDNPMSRETFGGSGEDQTASLQAGGSAGLGTTQQPDASQNRQPPPGTSSGLTLQRRQPPPPTVPTDQTAGQATAPPPSPVAQAAQPAAFAQPMIAPPPPSPYQAAKDRDTAILNQEMPKAKGGVRGVLQRLALAALSDTKLAGIAQQIAYPELSRQLAQRQRAANELEEIGKLEESEQRGQYYGAEAAAMTAQGRLRPIALRDGSLYDPSTHQIINNPKTIGERIQEYTQAGYDIDTARMLAAGMKPTEANTPLEIDPTKLPADMQGLIKPDAHGRTMVSPATLDKILENIKGATTGTNAPLGQDKVNQINALTSGLFTRLHPGQPVPPEYLLPPNATGADYTRIEGALKTEESMAGNDAQRQFANEIRKQTLALAQQNAANTAADRANKQDASQRSQVFKTYQPVMDSAERFNVMAQNQEDALKHHDQQAMLSLLANHLGMTMGLQKGARMNQAVINEAVKSRPWLQGMGSKFDKDGYLSGVTLTGPQMQQMVGLARDRFAQDVVKSRNEAQYIGATDDGPKRTPNTATMLMYLRLANGNQAAAKALAAQDGWTVQ